MNKQGRNFLGTFVFLLVFGTTDLRGDEALVIAGTEIIFPRLVYFGGSSLLGAGPGTDEELALSTVYLLNPLGTILRQEVPSMTFVGAALGSLSLKALAPQAGIWKNDVAALGRFGLFSASDLANFETYRSLRGLKGPGSTDLLLAPFDIHVLANPWVWGGILGEGAANLGLALLNSDTKSSVWSTGRTFMGASEIPLALGLTEAVGYALVTNTLIAAGEEAVFRGIIFRELNAAYGEWTARLVDMFVFPLAHIPNWIAKKTEFWNAVTEFVWLALDTYLLDSAYLDGGLEASTALHAHMNSNNRLIDWSFRAGVAR